MAVIGYNAAAVNAAYYLNQNSANLNSSLTELASGSRLANASTDAAGVAVSGDMTARIARLGAATQAAQDVVSYAQTTDGFLSTIQQQLSRMSELAQSATNGAFGSADRANYATEFNTLLTQIDSIANNAQFNGSSLFVAGNVTVAIDSTGTTDSFSTSTVGNSTSLGINGTTIDTTTAAAAAIGLLNTAITSLTSRRASVNADISKFNFYVQNMRRSRRTSRPLTPASPMWTLRPRARNLRRTTFSSRPAPRCLPRRILRSPRSPDAPQDK